MEIIAPRAGDRHNGEEHEGASSTHLERKVFMLVLSRKEGESILIGKDIRVIVVKIQGNQIRLGIEAPSRLSVVREGMFRFDRSFCQKDSA